MSQFLIDTGPLVAAINRRDRWHRWSQDQVSKLPAPLLTCEAVISEAWFLLKATDVGQRSLLKLIQRQSLQIGFAARDNVHSVVESMERYADIPMSFADACLVQMSELVDDCVVLTLDSDFRVYRRHGRKRIPLLIPDEV